MQAAGRGLCLYKIVMMCEDRTYPATPPLGRQVQAGRAELVLPLLDAATARAARHIVQMVPARGADGAATRHGRAQAGQLTQTLVGELHGAGVAFVERAEVDVDRQRALAGCVVVIEEVNLHLKLRDPPRAGVEHPPGRRRPHSQPLLGARTGRAGVVARRMRGIASPHRHLEAAPGRQAPEGVLCCPAAAVAHCHASSPWPSSLLRLLPAAACSRIPTQYWSTECAAGRRQASWTVVGCASLTRRSRCGAATFSCRVVQGTLA